MYYEASCWSIFLWKCASSWSLLHSSTKLYDVSLKITLYIQLGGSRIWTSYFIFLRISDHYYYYYYYYYYHISHSCYIQYSMPYFIFQLDSFKLNAFIFLYSLRNMHSTSRLVLRLLNNQFSHVPHNWCLWTRSRHIILLFRHVKASWTGSRM